MELTKADWKLIKFLTIEEDLESLNKILESLESGLHFVGVERNDNHVDFVFE